MCVCVCVCVRERETHAPTAVGLTVLSHLLSYVDVCPTPITQSPPSCLSSLGRRSLNAGRWRQLSGVTLIPYRRFPSKQGLPGFMTVVMDPPATQLALGPGKPWWMEVRRDALLAERCADRVERCFGRKVRLDWVMASKTPRSLSEQTHCHATREAHDVNADLSSL